MAYVNHAGAPVDPDADFYVEPPEAIGDPLSGYSSLKKSHEPMDGGRRFFWSTLAAAACAGIGFAFGNWIDAGATVLFFAGGGLGTIVGVAGTSFGGKLSYIGTEGYATYSLSGSRQATAKGQICEFAKAEELRVNTTRHFTNGIYTSTTYDYSWYDASNRKVFSLNGSYSKKDGPPDDTNHDFYLADGAEVAWTRHYLKRCLAQLEQGRPVSFNIRSGGIRIDIGQSHFALTKGSGTEQWSLSDLRGLDVDKGFVILTSEKFQNSGWLGRLFGSGQIRFQYDSLPNARVFFLLFEHLLG